MILAMTATMAPAGVVNKYIYDPNEDIDTDDCPETWWVTKDYDDWYDEVEGVPKEQELRLTAENISDEGEMIMAQCKQRSSRDALRLATHMYYYENNTPDETKAAMVRIGVYNEGGTDGDFDDCDLDEFEFGHAKDRDVARKQAINDMLDAREADTSWVNIDYDATFTGNAYMEFQHDGMWHSMIRITS